MKKIIWIAAGVLLWMSCGDSEVQVPKDLLPNDSFIEVLIDLQLREGMGSYSRQSLKEAEAESLNSEFMEILEKHEVDPEDFKKTYDFYILYPELMEGIYEQVLDSLSKLESEIKQKFTKEERLLNDSLQKANQRKYDSIRGIAKPRNVEME